MKRSEAYIKQKRIEKLIKLVYSKANKKKGITPGAYHKMLEEVGISGRHLRIEMNAAKMVRQIKAIRIEKGISTYRFRKLTKINIARIEQQLSVRYLGVIAMYRIADGLGISLSDLWGKVERT